MGHKKSTCPKRKGVRECKERDGDGDEADGEVRDGEVGSDEKEEVKEARDEAVAAKNEKEKKRGRRGGRAAAVEEESETEEVASKKQAGVRAANPARKTRAQSAVEEEADADEPVIISPPTRTQPSRGTNVGEKKKKSAKVSDMCSLCIGRRT